MRTLIAIAAVALIGGAVIIWSLHGSVDDTTVTLTAAAPR
jgi:hypothetical protein